MSGRAEPSWGILSMFQVGLKELVVKASSCKWVGRRHPEFFFPQVWEQPAWVGPERYGLGVPDHTDPDPRGGHQIVPDFNDEAVFPVVRGKFREPLRAIAAYEQFPVLHAPLHLQNAGFRRHASVREGCPARQHLKAGLVCLWVRPVELLELDAAALLSLGAIRRPCNRGHARNRPHSGHMVQRRQVGHAIFVDDIDYVGVRVVYEQDRGEWVPDAEVDGP